MAKILKSKKGLSAIVTTVILIGISIAAVSLVWGIVNNVVNKQVKNTESCFGNFNKIKINEYYTCYEKEEDNYRIQFSLEIGDIDVDKIIVGISSLTNSQIYEIANSEQVIENLMPYNGEIGQAVVLPSKNSGKTYVTDYIFESIVDSIKISPVIGGVQCDVSDTINQIQDCALISSD